MNRVQRGARGMALVAVLWVVAALSVLVAGLSHAVRQHTRVVTAARDATVAHALGDGAVQAGLQMLQATTRPALLQTSTIQLGGVPIKLTVQPLSGLIDLNHAPPPLLTALLQVAGQLPGPMAGKMADTLVEWRMTRPDGGGLPRRFEAVEDLLLVPGVDYALYDRLRPLVTTDQQGGGRVSPMAAQADVLAVLLNGDLARAQQIAAARDAGQTGIDLTSINPTLVENTSTPRYRVQAEVPLGEGKIATFVRVVLLQNSPSGLPWRTLRTERSVALSSKS